MRRVLLVLSIGIIAIFGVLEWRSTRAADEKAAKSNQITIDLSDYTKMVERIEELEKRMTTLEGTQTLIRQADSRANMEYVPVQPQQLPKIKSPTRAVPAPKFFEDESENLPEDEAQTTNGHRWKVRLLGHSTPVY